MSTPDWEVRARESLGETAECKERALVSFRKLLADELEQRPPVKIRKDDEYFLRFLRYSKFDVRRAVDCFINFYSLWGQYPNKIWPINKAPSDWKFYWAKMLSSVSPRKNWDRSTVLLYRKGLWKPGSDDVVCADALAALFWFLEMLLEDPAVQVDGFTLIMDGQGFGWTFLPHLDLNAIKVLVHTVQDAFPARFKAIHVVHQPGLYDYIYACIRPFLKPKIVKRIHLHGSDMKSLHEHVDPEILPEEYGGQAGPFSNDWICQQLYQRDEEFRRYSHYGFARDGK